MKETERRELGKCPQCGTTIWSDHPYAWCAECGSSLPEYLKAHLPWTWPSTTETGETAETGTTLEVEGRTIPCPICGHDRFWTRKTLMGARGGTLFGVDWANRFAENYICYRCGHVLWFLRR